MLSQDPVVFPSLPPLDSKHGSTAAFGLELFREHLLVFELTSILVLVGIIGAVHLSLSVRRRQRSELENQSPSDPPETMNQRPEEPAHV